MKLESIPQPVSWAVILQGPVVGFLDVLNPILQAVSFVVAIIWGGIQIYSWWKKRR